MTPCLLFAMRGAVELFLGLVARNTTSLEGLQVYYINMDTSKDRRSIMEDMLTKAALPANRVSAVTTEAISRGDFDEKYVRPQGISAELMLKNTSKIFNKTVACYVSHVETLERAFREMTSPEQVAMVLEDDIEISKNWQATLQSTMDAAPQDWELLKLSGWGMTRSVDQMPPASQDHNLTFYRITAPFTSSSWAPVFYYGGSAAYLVRKSSIPQVLASLRSQPINDFDAMLLGNQTSKRYEVRPVQLKLRPDHSFSQIHPTGFLQSIGTWCVHTVYNFLTRSSVK